MAKCGGSSRASSANTDLPEWLKHDRELVPAKVPGTTCALVHPQGSATMGLRQDGREDPLEVQIGLVRWEIGGILEPAVRTLDGNDLHGSVWEEPSQRWPTCPNDCGITLEIRV